VNVNKSVTILAIPGAPGSVVALGGNAIDIATARRQVALRQPGDRPLRGRRRFYRHQHGRPPGPA